ncbi:MAG: hypothetical protein HQK53_04015 [Oligoflexia bacterium]|nr:hypothetical protein [Oligoflexia bacterium]
MKTTSVTLLALLVSLSLTNVVNASGPEISLAVGGIVVGSSAASSVAADLYRRGEGINLDNSSEASAGAFGGAGSIAGIITLAILLDQEAQNSAAKKARAIAIAKEIQEELQQEESTQEVLPQ